MEVREYKAVLKGSQAPQTTAAWIRKDLVETLDTAVKTHRSFSGVLWRKQAMTFYKEAGRKWAALHKDFPSLFPEDGLKRAVEELAPELHSVILAASSPEKSKPKVTTTKSACVDPPLP